MNPKFLIVVLIAVLIGLAVSYAGGQGGAVYMGLPVMVCCALLAFAINWIAYIPANIKQTEHFYDLTGSITYISVIGFAVVFSGDLDTRGLLAAIMVLVWAIRLGSFLVLRIRQDGKDDRFDEIKTNPLRFLSAWTLQGLWVILTAACALVIITSSSSKAIGLIGAIGIIIWIVGFIIEVIADAQKRAFRRNKNNAGRFINTGLWSWSRHPNYFGEIMLWVGMAVFALPILSAWQYLTLVSPLFVYLLLTKVSGIPMLRAKSDARWGEEAEYQHYIKTTSKLLPLPPRS